MKSFLAVLENAGVGAWVRDLRTGTVLLTQKLWDQLGYEDDGEPKNLSEWLSLVHPDDVPEYETRVHEHLSGLSDQLHCSFRFKDARGSWRMLELHGRIVERGEAGEPLFMGGMVAEITGRSPVNLELFKAVVEAATEGIWMNGLDGLTSFANQRMAAMLATTPEAMIGRLPTDFIFPEDHERALGIISRTLAGGSEEFEISFRRADGGTIPVLGGSAPIRDESGAITGAVAMFSNLTARKATERALLESEEQARINHARLAAAQEGAGAGAWEIDLTTGAILLDERSLRMHGLPSNTPMPMTQEQWAATLDANADDALKALRDCVEEGVQFNFEFSTQGGKNWILSLGRGIGTDKGPPRKVVGLNLNITESKHAEQQLTRIRGEFVHLARVSAMGSMASSIAHELNQPLAAASNYLSAAQMMLQRREYIQAAAAVNSATETTLKAGDIIRKIRDGVVRRNPLRRELDLREVANSALQLALLDAPQKGIRVDKQLKRGIRVMIDPIQIEQVIINLVRNAVDAVAQRKNPAISILATVNDGRAAISVKDNGSGVPQEMADNLFEAFASSKEGGMGIGLSICRTIIEAHEGRIWLENTSSEGTVFKFDLPLSSIEKQMAGNPAFRL